MCKVAKEKAQKEEESILDLSEAPLAFCEILCLCVSIRCTCVCSHAHSICMYLHINYIIICKHKYITNIFNTIVIKYNV